MRRVLVTGGAGFIGSHLVRRLVAADLDVIVADDFSTGRRENLADLRRVAVVERDLASERLDDLLVDVDVVFHLAAVPSVPRSVAEPLRSHAAAATATLRLLVAARESGVQRFVTSSSSSVYGDVATPPMRESMPTMARSPYGVAKLAAEGYTRVFASLFGMGAVSLRYFNIFGPRQDSASPYAAAIPRFITAYLRDVRPIVYGDGQQSRDFTYVDNAVEANVLAARAPDLDGSAVNIAAGAPRTVLGILRAIADIFGRWIEPVFEPPRPGDIRHSHADISRARELLGYEPRVSFTEGLRQTVEWLRSRATAVA